MTLAAHQGWWSAVRREKTLMLLSKCVISKGALARVQGKRALAKVVAPRRRRRPVGRGQVCVNLQRRRTMDSSPEKPLPLHPLLLKEPQKLPALAQVASKHLCFQSLPCSAPACVRDSPVLPSESMRGNQALRPRDPTAPGTEEAPGPSQDTDAPRGQILSVPFCSL